MRSAHTFAPVCEKIRLPAVQFDVGYGPSAVLLEAKGTILLAVGENGQLWVVRGDQESGALLSHQHRLGAVGCGRGGSSNGGPSADQQARSLVLAAAHADCRSLSPADTETDYPR